VKSSSNRANQKAFNGVVHINRATVSEFDSLDGIGPVIAKRIVKYRETNGPFVDIADLQKVDGIGAKTFEKMKDRLSL
jgi:competence protein ComEA